MVPLVDWHQLALKFSGHIHSIVRSRNLRAGSEVNSPTSRTRPDRKYLRKSKKHQGKKTFFIFHIPALVHFRHLHPSFQEDLHESGVPWSQSQSWRGPHKSLCSRYFPHSRELISFPLILDVVVANLSNLQKPKVSALSTLSHS